MCGPLAEQIAFLDRVALAEEAALFTDRARAEVAARRLLLREIADKARDDSSQGEGV